MDERILEIAARIRGLRDDLRIAPEEMATILEMSVSEYLAHESGQRDFSFTFLYNVAQRFGVDITELLTGAGPKLHVYTHVKKGSGLVMQRREGFSYRNLAHLFVNRTAEPFVVEAPWDEALDAAPIALRSHAGQEFDYVLKGSLRMRIDNHEFIVNEGDSVYYDASKGHGMVATNGEPCTFLAIVMKECSGGAF